MHARVLFTGGDGKVERMVGGRREVGRARRGITKAVSKARRRRPRVEGKCGKGRAAESESEEGSRGEAQRAQAAGEVQRVNRTRRRRETEGRGHRVTLESAVHPLTPTQTRLDARLVEEAGPPRSVAL